MSVSFIAETSTPSPSYNVCRKMEKIDGTLDKCFYIVDVDQLPNSIDKYKFVCQLNQSNFKVAKNSNYLSKVSHSLGNTMI